jgi:minor extracellular protease Epr
MVKLLSVCFVILLAGCTSGQNQEKLIHSSLTPMNVQYTVNGSNENIRVNILFKQTLNPSIVTENNGRVIETVSSLAMMTAEVPVNQLEKIKHHPDVLIVEEDQIVELKPEKMDWGITATNTSVAWNSDFKGNGIKIAVLDSGVDLNHEDVNVAGGTSFVAYTTSYQDDNGHGTHVTGIIGAKHNDIGVAGVAPNAELYAIKVLNSEGLGYISDIAAGINWAIINHIDIINLSIGTQKESSILKSLIQKAFTNNIIVVAAAGNDGAEATQDTIDYPARYEETVAVGAVDTNHNHPTFSSTGPALDLVAPGVNIISTYSNNKYVSMDGTSMAVPYVSGILALWIEANPTRSPSSIRDQILSSSLDLGIAGKDPVFGHGLIQAPSESMKENEVLREESGEIGHITILRPINLWWRNEQNKLIFSRILTPGSKFRVYNKDDLYGGQFAVGGNHWVTNMMSFVRYEPYGATENNHSVVTKGPRGEIGHLYIHRKINLWKRDNNNKLSYVRILSPGQVFRVYSTDDRHGGQHNVGGYWVTDIPGYVTFEKYGDK